jgi:Ion channel
LAAAGSSPALLVLALGIATALNAVLHMVTAVVRRLILGHHDSHAPDVQVATLTREWAVARDSLGNLSFYFLLLVYLVIVGFAGLYSAINAFDAHAFDHGHLALSFVTWLYLSITTLATVGFGDVHPVSVGAQVAVIA